MTLGGTHFGEAGDLRLANDRQHGLLRAVHLRQGVLPHRLQEMARLLQSAWCPESSSKQHGLRRAVHLRQGVLPDRLRRKTGEAAAVSTVSQTHVTACMVSGL